MRIVMPAIVTCFVIAASSSLAVADEPTSGTESAVLAATKAPADAQAGQGVAAMRKAAKSNRYLFALFHKEDNEQTTAMRQVLDGVMKKAADRADAVEVDVTAASEKEIVDHFDAAYAPMPLLLAIAPNGAVTAGFPGRVDERSLIAAFASPRTTECLKALQERRLVLLCVQNGGTESAKQAMLGVREFERDERFAGDVKVVVVDPADKEESQLMSDLEIDPATKEAVTVFLAPPGRCIGQFRGATNLEDLVATLAGAMSGCGSCGPGGCGSCGPSGCEH